MKEIQRQILICFSIGAAVFAINLLLFSNLDKSLLYYFRMFGIMQLYSFVIGLSNMYLFNLLDFKKFWEKHPKRRLIVGILLSIGLTMFCLFLLNMFTAIVLFGQEWEAFIKSQNGMNYYFGLSITVTVVLGFHIVYFFNKVNENKVREHKIIAKTETAKYESLKNQIDPHFLFNSLNVLTSLIGENPLAAEKFTTKLSKVYRYVLEQKNKDLISLEEELKFAKSYTSLLEMRFENAVIFDIPKEVSRDNLKIIPLSLQLLLENSIKHNVATQKNPLHVRILEKEGFLEVTNNYNPKKTLEKGTKIGLQNIVDRYDLITPKKVEIIQNEKEFKVKLPLLTKKIKTMKSSENPNEKYPKVLKQVEEIKGFYASLMAYCIVIPGLVILYFSLTPNSIQWFWFPMMGWGLGLTIQGCKAFKYHPFLGTDWERKKVKELMDKEDKEFWN